MRILSGKWGGRKIFFEENSVTHPMGEREKNAMFNMIGELSDLVILDWFAGSGQVGLECLSRGAKRVIFIEKDKRNRANIKRNLAEFGEAPDNVEVLAEKSGLDLKFDLIFADPPYDKFSEFDFSGVAEMLKDSGRFVLSSPKSAETPEIVGMKILKSNIYAGARISIYQKM